MSKGGWFIIIAVGGLASAQAATYVVNYNGVDLICDDRGCSRPLAKDNDCASDAQCASDGPAEEGGEPITVQNAAITYSPSSDSPSDQEAQREKDDLKAQQDMARWAFWMFVATTAGVGLIGWTLHETRKAAKLAADTFKQAKIATSAAVTTADVTREIGEAQTRAYLAASGGKFTLYGDLPEFSFTIEFTNKGNSPAREIFFYPQIIINHWGMGDDSVLRTKFSPLRITEIPARETRGRDGIIDVGPALRHLVEALANTNASVKVGGNLTFIDDFGRVRKTKVAVAGFYDGKAKDEDGFLFGTLKPVNPDLWSKRQLRDAKRRKRRG